MAILTDVIKAFPNFSDPFHTLGLVHEAAGNPRKALDFFMIAAHMSPKDATQWKRLAALSTDLGFFKQAIYCLTRVLRQDKKDVDAKWDRAVLYAEIQETRQAVKEFELLAVIRTGDPEVPKMLARLHHRIGASHKAIEVGPIFVINCFALFLVAPADFAVI